MLDSSLRLDRRSAYLFKFRGGCLGVSTTDLGRLASGVGEVGVEHCGLRTRCHSLETVDVSAGEVAQGRPLVVLLCGVAGSGKTTYAQQLEMQGYVRLSIDEEVWARFGRYGIDFDPADYARLSASAEDALRDRLVALIRHGRDVVVDFSFWQRASRDRYKRLIEATGGTWRLIYLQVDPAVLRERLDARAERFDANAAFPITRDTLVAYIAGFEEPQGEGEEVITFGETS